MGIGPLVGYPPNSQNWDGTQPSRAVPQLCPCTRDLSEDSQGKRDEMGVHKPWCPFSPSPRVVPLSSCPSHGWGGLQPPRHPLCATVQPHSSLSHTWQCPVPSGAVAPTCPPAGEPPIPSLRESPAPSLGVALGPLVSSQDDCCPYPITCGSRVPYWGVPCPLLGVVPIPHLRWSLPEGRPCPLPGGVVPCGRGSLPGTGGVSPARR